MFKGAKLKKSFDQRNHAGFIYSVTLYKSDKALGGFGFGYDQINVSKDNQSIRYISSKNIDETQIKEIAQKYNLNN